MTLVKFVWQVDSVGRLSSPSLQGVPRGTSGECTEGHDGGMYDII